MTKSRTPKNIEKKNRDYFRNRYNNEVDFRMAVCLRQRLRDALSKTKKNDSMMSLIGCSLPELKSHLQKEFKPGMSWDNYAFAWHIDHILPCIMFNLTLFSEQEKCFHWSNLQPLWRKDNLRKSGKFDIEDDTLTSIYLLFQ